jgi:hypothetical protein
MGAQGPDSALEVGRALFHGERPLHGRINGHNTELPLAACGCANCHAKESSKVVRDPASSAEEFGPALGPNHLQARRERRGGPPSVYDLASFCRLLRDGVDPAHIVLGQAMPRYALPDASCQALWAFLNTP